MEKGITSRNQSRNFADRGQYALTVGVTAVMLYSVGFPLFAILFLGAAIYFVNRLFSFSSKTETRRIFEFYLSANEILRDDERSWFGFEIREAIEAGERISAKLLTAPPLVHFALGALYAKSGDHSSAAKRLAYVLEQDDVNEASIVYPTPELGEYVRILRKIERDPAKSPLTSSAVRSLERMRSNRGSDLLEESRKLAATAPHNRQIESTDDHARFIDSSYRSDNLDRESANSMGYSSARLGANEQEENDPPFAERKPITEVLHDIYDKKVH